MKVLQYDTYRTTKLEVTFGKWNHDRSYGTGGKSGWFFTICFPWFTGRRIVQIRHDVF